LEPGDVVIRGTLAVHESAKASKILREKGTWFLFLPPCSPDLNPMEMVFAKLKAQPRNAAVRTFDALWCAIGDIRRLFSPTECWTFFNAAGYASYETHDALGLPGLLENRGAAAPSARPSEKTDRSYPIS
jgi:transposase